jgi:hypothetical protein
MERITEDGDHDASIYSKKLMAGSRYTWTWRLYTISPAKASTKKEA